MYQVPWSRQIRPLAGFHLVTFHSSLYPPYRELFSGFNISYWISATFSYGIISHSLHSTWPRPQHRPALRVCLGRQDLAGYTTYHRVRAGSFSSSYHLTTLQLVSAWVPSHLWPWVKVLNLLVRTVTTYFPNVEIQTFKVAKNTQT